MWNFLAREAAKQIGGRIAAGKMIGIDEANGPEVYADRIKRDFHLHDYADAWALYDSDRTYWENYYHPRSNGPASNTETVRDSAAAAGVPSRNNVFEYGFPEPNPTRASVGEVSPVRIPNGPAWNNAFVRDSAAAAAVPSRNNVFEYGFPDANSAQPSIGPAPSPQLVPGSANRSSLPSGVFASGAPAFPFSPAAFQNAPRGLPGLLAEAGAVDPANPEWPPSGGLPGLIREYLRNN
jgi:hypothetical protein